MQVAIGMARSSHISTPSTWMPFSLLFAALLIVLLLVVLLFPVPAQ